MYVCFLFDSPWSFPHNCSVSELNGPHKNNKVCTIPYTTLGLLYCSLSAGDNEADWSITCDVHRNIYPDSCSGPAIHELSQFNYLCKVCECSIYLHPIVTHLNMARDHPHADHLRPRVTAEKGNTHELLGRHSKVRNSDSGTECKATAGSHPGMTREELCHVGIHLDSPV